MTQPELPCKARRTIMPNTIVVGDLHGRIEFAERVIKDHLASDNIIFVGDYLDSYDQPWWKQFMTLHYVTTQANSHDNVFALLGNHELSYTQPHIHLCSGHNAELSYYLDISGARESVNSLLEYIWIPTEKPTLITHAGLSARLFNKPADEITLEDIHHKLDSGSRHNIGLARGGRNSCGGIFWCDFHEEFKPIPAINQVFGHTHMHHIDSVVSGMNKGANYCVDNQGSYEGTCVLVRDDGSMSPIHITV